MQRRNVALDGAVRLHGDESALVPSLSSGASKSEVLGVHLGKDHGYIRRPAVRGVVRHHGRLGLGVAFLQRSGFVLRHVHAQKMKSNRVGHLIEVSGVPHDIPAADSGMGAVIAQRPATASA